MKENLYVINGCILIFVISIFFAIKDIQKNIKQLKDIGQTLDYIDTRMDSLEFFKVPENAK